MQNSMQTYARQTLLFGEDELTSLQAASPASRSRSRASAKARRTSVTCGRKCCGLFGLFDLAGSWARTFSELLIGRKEWSSSRCVLTWRQQDMRFNRSLFRLAVSGLPTEGTDAGSSPILLKIPCAFDATTITPKKNPVPGNSGCLAQEVMCGYAARRGLLPTVQTQGLKQCKNGKTVFMPLSLLPTPTVNDATNSSLPPSQVKRKSGLPKIAMQSDEYRTGTTSQLNPQFVAEMMGFPVDWTVLPFLAGCGNRLKPTETPSCLK